MVVAQAPASTPNRVVFLLSVWLREARIFRRLAVLGPKWVVMSHPEMPFFATPSRLDVAMVARFLHRLHRGTRGWRPHLVVDLHDVRSLQMRDLVPGTPADVLRRFVRLESVSLREADWILSPPGGWLDLLPRRYGIERAKLIPMPNGGIRPPVTAGLRRRGEEFTYVYAGTLAKSGRGVSKLIEAFRRTRDPRLRLLLLGPGGEWLGQVSADDSRIRWLGALPVSECAAVLGGCDVGLYPYPDVPYLRLTHTTAKFAAYVTAGLPILATWNPTIADALASLGIGSTCRWEGLSAVLESLPRRQEDLCRWRRRAEELAPAYTWSSVFQHAFSRIPGFPEEGVDRTGVPESS